jgi:hypothetical protein
LGEIYGLTRSTIVFEKSPRQNISSPQQPPGWWR